jgi:hypothetical protein
MDFLLPQTRQTNQQTKDLLLQRHTAFFLSFLLAFDRSVATKNRHLEKKGREGKKEGEQEQEFFGLGIRFCEFSGFVGEGVDVAAVLLTVVVCG